MQEADHILIPLLDGSSGRAQVARSDDKTILVFITGEVSHGDKLPAVYGKSDIVAAVLVDNSAMTWGQWRYVGYDAIPRGVTQPSWPANPETDTIHDPAVIEAFVNALHGQYPWDGFPDRDFFTDLLIGGADAIPEAAIYSADLPSPSDS